MSQTSSPTPIITTIGLEKVYGQGEGRVTALQWPDLEITIGDFYCCARSLRMR